MQHENDAGGTFGEAPQLRSLIVGNSGSGKSTFAERLGELVHAPVFDLDLIHWQDDGFGAKEDEAVARQKVADLAAAERGVIEGVYGWLAAVAVPRATALVWLDVPWELCRQGLVARGQRRGGTEADLVALCQWAAAYWERQSSTSFEGHRRLFEAFTGAKYRFGDHGEVDRFFERLSANHRSRRIESPTNR